MKLTTKLRAAIVKQFRDGESAQYLADLYEQKLPRVEQALRDEMKRLDLAALEIIGTETQKNVGSPASDVGAQFIAPSEAPVASEILK